MNRLKGFITSSMAVLLAAGMTLNFGGCSKESPISPTVDSDQQADFQILAKKGGNGGRPSTLESSSTSISLESSSTSTSLESSSTSISLADYNTGGSTIEQGSTICCYTKSTKAYSGGKINLSQGSKFVVGYNSLTPPSELMRQNVTLTMTVIQVANNELVFEFGPSGSSFEPAATVRFHYSGSNPKLYYINEDGTYVEQQPDEVDTNNKWLMLKINHFSRYAVAWAN